MGDKRVHAFPKGINPKVNGIARLEFELTYDDVGHDVGNSLTTESGTEATRPLHTYWNPSSIEAFISSGIVITTETERVHGSSRND